MAQYILETALISAYGTETDKNSHPSSSEPARLLESTVNELLH